ncbi:MAG: HAMP domain-containing protein [Candidatus Omnitrophota bacterium]
MGIIKKRRRYFIKRAFQIKYTALILFFIFLTAIISCAITYLAIFPYLSEKLANVYPQGRLLTVINQANVKAIGYIAWLLPIAAWFGIILSHSFAGPWHRLENILDEMASGILSPEVKLRKGDELQSLATAINEVTKNLRSMSQDSIKYINLLNDAVRSLSEELNRDHIDTMKTKLLISKIQDFSTELKYLQERHKSR